MTNFKEQLNLDIADVFHNTTEFAEVLTVKYAGEEFNVPSIFDHDINRPRTMPSGDRANGVSLFDIRLYLNETDIAGVYFTKGKDITVGVNRYTIARAAYEACEIVLDLEMLAMLAKQCIRTLT